MNHQGDQTVSTTPFWITAFLDVPAERHAPCVDFWATVTRSEPVVSETYGEYTSLVPPDGEVILRIQRTGDDENRTHLDIHVTDPRAATERAVRLGATERAAPEGADWHVLTSPGGLDFCLVPDAVGTRPASVEHAHASWVVDQVCLDVPPSRFDVEHRFWRRLTGLEFTTSGVAAEFSPSVRPPGQPFRLMLQRLADERDRVGAHLDLASTDRAGVVDHHRSLGASVVNLTDIFTVMRDPGGSIYCITDRDPSTGVL